MCCRPIWSGVWSACIRSGSCSRWSRSAICSVSSGCCSPFRWPPRPACSRASRCGNTWRARSIPASSRGERDPPRSAPARARARLRRQFCARGFSLGPAERSGVRSDRTLARLAGPDRRPRWSRGLGQEPSCRHLGARARSAHGGWTVGLRDLASRLRAVPTVALAPPDDALLRAVLVKQFADRQVGVDEGLIGYLASRIERSFAAARAAVATLDREALRQKRPVSRALAAELFRERD